MGVVTYLVILLVLVLVCVYTAKVAYRRGLNTIPEALKPKFGLKEALQLKPVLDKMGVVSPVMAVYTTKLVAMLGAVNNLASDVAAAVADRDRQVSGLQRSIAANEAAIKEAQAAIIANGNTIVVATAARADVIALGKMFGV